MRESTINYLRNENDNKNKRKNRGKKNDYNDNGTIIKRYK